MIQVNSIPISSKYFDFQDFSEVIQPSIKKLPSIFLPKNPDCIKTSTIQSTWTAFDGEWKKGKRLNLCSHKKCKLSKSCENNIFAPWENGSWASLKRGTWKNFHRKFDLHDCRLLNWPSPKEHRAHEFGRIYFLRKICRRQTSWTKPFVGIEREPRFYF